MSIAAASAAPFPMLGEPTRVFKRRNAICLPEGAAFLHQSSSSSSPLTYSPPKKRDLRHLEQCALPPPSASAVNSGPSKSTAAASTTTKEGAALPPLEPEGTPRATAITTAVSLVGAAAETSSSSSSFPENCRKGRRNAITSMPEVRDKHGRRPAICSSLFLDSNATRPKSYSAPVMEAESCSPLPTHRPLASLSLAALSLNDSSASVSTPVPAAPLPLSALNDALASFAQDQPRAGVSALLSRARPPSPQCPVSLEQLSSHEFNLWNYTDEQLIQCAVMMFEALELCKEFSIEKETLENFLRAARFGYGCGKAIRRRSTVDVRHRSTASLAAVFPAYEPSPLPATRERSASSPEPSCALMSALRDGSNSYHNFRHAFDVLQMTFHLLYRCELRLWLDPLAQLSLLVSAICHDLAHTGTNNAFHVATLSELAIIYNDKSVLENFHAANTFRLLLQDDGKQNILAHLSPEQFRRARGLIIENILSTDMARHNTMVSGFKNQFCKEQKEEDLKEKQAVAVAATPVQQLAPGEAEHLFCGYLLHAADIGNVTRPMEISKQWTRVLIEEFFEQGDIERELGLPVTPMMDRTKYKSDADSTLGFIQYVARPTFEELLRFSANTEHLVDNINLNEELWKMSLASAASKAE